MSREEAIAMLEKAVKEEWISSYDERDIEANMKANEKKENAS